MSIETFSIEWDLVTAALKGKIKLHPKTLEKFNRDVITFYAERITEMFGGETSCY